MCSSVLPEKSTWSIDEIYNKLYGDSENEKQKTLENLKAGLKRLEEKGAVIFVNDFESISLVEPKLFELVGMDGSK
ncbi:MAG: hypothetical protein M3162_03610 [Thermoproteota archaeon]|nr:hypothetical protein [Thermoproteota archaeon]